MVEKAGHRNVMHKMRLDWINEGKPKSTIEEDNGESVPEPEPVPNQRAPTRIAPIFEKAADSRQGTLPHDEDLFGDDDIYNATPLSKGQNSTRASDPDIPDDHDDLDALMAAAEMQPGIQQAPGRTLFGPGSSQPRESGGEPDEDDLDALMAEAEAQESANTGLPRKSLFGGPSVKSQLERSEDDQDDLDALIAEAEASHQG